MWPFKRAANVEATTLQRIENLEKQVNKLKTECLDNATDIEAIRDKVLRKIQNARKKEEPETDINERPGIIGYGHIRRN
jgi:molecular chaperone GrpE (heat shock protein)